MCTNAELFSVMSTSLPGRPSPIVAMRYSSGCLHREPDIGQALGPQHVDGGRLIARHLLHHLVELSKYLAHTASSSASLSAKCR